MSDILYGTIGGMLGALLIFGIRALLDYMTYRNNRGG
jgi:hypothetical protein